jgi:CRP-like cAMP-binding protein
LTVHPYAGGRSADLAKVLELCTTRNLATSDVLTTEGDQGDEAYFLLHGTVRVLKKGPRGADQELAQIPAPALLGHMSLVDHSQRSATCVAAAPCQILVLDRRTFGTLLTESSSRGTALRRLLLSSLTRQLMSGNALLQGLLVEPEPESGASTSSGASHSTAPKNRHKPAARSSGDISDNDLLRAAGVLEGWSIDSKGVEDVTLVEDEDMRRGRLDSKQRC